MSRIGRALYLVGLALAVVLPLRAWVAEPITIASASMEPTLRVGSLMILDKWSLSGRRPRRGEIVSFRSPIEAEDLVKRVIAVPGDTVEIRDKRVIVNDQPLTEPYAVHDRPNERLEGDDLGPLTVPAASYFVLGDNRDESKDSSVWKSSSGERVYFTPASSLQGVVRNLPWIL
ncbi:MAG TPA: signal peptidase I [Elusimicrobiota bacterium]|nr:signal peptidase I [Elusimicrobiota bacterium]